MSGGLAFAFPWVLSALLALPGLWWLLKAVPPPPRTVVFPPIRLLIGLVSRQKTPDHMPLWLLILRVLLAAALIVAAAGPVLGPQSRPSQTTGPLLIAFDDGWQTALDWSARQQWIEDRLKEAGRQGRAVYLVPTAPPMPSALGPLRPDQALTALQGWRPKPWESDRDSVVRALGRMPTDQGIESVWLADGVEDGNSRAFIAALARLGNGPTVVLGRTGAALASGAEGQDLGLQVKSLSDDAVTVVALDDLGRELARTVSASSQASFSLPLSLRNRIGRVVIEGDHGAASTVLMDERSRRRIVALVERTGEAGQQPLLDSLTYVAKAAMPFAEIKSGAVSDNLADNPSVLVFDTGIKAEDFDAVRTWVEAGGMLLRFADGTIAQNPDEPLLPTRLRAGGRELGGVLSWSEPQSLSPFPADGPFDGLAIPDDTAVRSQVLADPDFAPGVKIWARLADGTPLVTARPLGRGWVVLFHCAATPTWSSLPLTGLFPEMLHRLVLMSRSGAVTETGPFKPVRVLDGFGALGAPSSEVTAITLKTEPGPGHPPGLYGDPAAPMAFNLGDHIRPLHPLTLPSSIRVQTVRDRGAERDLRPAFLILALVLGLADLVLTSRLVRVVALLAVMACPAARAAEDWTPGLETRLAYVKTGDAAIDKKSLAGLQALTKVLAARSTAVLADPKGVALDADPLAFYPLLYWPVTQEGGVPSDWAAAEVKRYLKRGGLIVFDRQDGGGTDPTMNAAMRRINRALDLPLVRPIAADHVLTRSFYLIRSMPGRFTGGAVWVQADGAENDGVSSVVLGSNDWAGEWAGLGDEAEREASFRFGVNLCIYALTGNYKADQVHMPAILERLGRQP